MKFSAYKKMSPVPSEGIGPEVFLPIYSMLLRQMEECRSRINSGILTAHKYMEMDIEKGSVDEGEVSRLRVELADWLLLEKILLDFDSGCGGDHATSLIGCIELNTGMKVPLPTGATPRRKHEAA